MTQDIHSSWSVRIRARHAALGASLLVSSLAACSAASPSGDATSPSQQAEATTASSGSAGTGAAPSCGLLTVSATAATQTAQTDPLCTAIQPFYWEIGDAHTTAFTLVAGGSLSAASQTPVLRSTEMPIASASKFLYGAYTVQVNAALLALPANKTTPTTPALDTAFHALTMRTGYDSLNDDLCALEELNPNATIADCFHLSNNDKPTLLGDGGIDTVDFYYGGGNFQSYATNDTALANDTATELATEYKRVLGADIPLSFLYPELAGGMQMSAGDYAVFLRKVLNGNLLLSQYLGYAPVCTLPASEDVDAGPACPTATYSPAANRPWLYSWGHWIESDGAFSSPGKLGFYPWIDRCEQYYGIVAREDHATGAYIASAECGADIRGALFSGHVYANGAPVP